MPTTDVDNFYAEPPGALVPFGGFAAQKGCGLGLVVDILSGAVRDADCTREEVAGPGNGRFVTAINFASLAVFSRFNRADYGHKNIYFRDDTAPQINRYDSRTDSPTRLYKYLKELGKDVLVVPHHPAYAHHLTNWHYHDSQLSPLVEVNSCWGSSEHLGALRQVPEGTVPGFYVQDALARGYHLGFIGSSDGHN